MGESNSPTYYLILSEALDKSLQILYESGAGFGAKLGAKFREDNGLEK